MATKTTSELVTYVVLSDAVVLNTGNKDSSGKPEVTRLLRGSTINAPEGHPALADLLALGGVAVQSDTAALKAIRDRGNHRRPTLVKTEDGNLRITIAGAAALQGSPDDPAAKAQENVLPAEPDEF